MCSDYQMRHSHRVLIRHAMRHMAFLSGEIDTLDREILDWIEETKLTPAFELLQNIPGIQHWPQMLPHRHCP